MNGQEFKRTKDLMSAAVDVLRSEGVAIRQRDIVPLLSAARFAAQDRVEAEHARAFDALPDDDEIPEDGNESDTDRQCRAAAHRVLDRLITAHRSRKRSGRRANDEERQDQQAMLSLLPLRNAFPPGRAADAIGDDDLGLFRRSAAECTGGVF